MNKTRNSLLQIVPIELCFSCFYLMFGCFINDLSREKVCIKLPYLKGTTERLSIYDFALLTTDTALKVELNFAQKWYMLST